MAEQAGLSHEERVRSVFAEYKRIDTIGSLYRHLIPFPNVGGALLPTCTVHGDDGKLVTMLARWREENSRAFPTQFKVTLEGTWKWLRKGILENENRMLFLVLDRLGYRVGHLGLGEVVDSEQSIEVENVVRGVTDAQPGVMTVAMQTMLQWAYERFAPNKIELRVFSTNEHAIGYYRKIGFVDDGLIALRKRIEGDRVSYREVDPHDHAQPDRYFLRMRHEPEGE